MEHQITVPLTEQEYSVLVAEATRSGKQPETILRELMSEKIRLMSEKIRTASRAKSPLTEHEFMEQQYREGKTLNIPSRRPLTAQEQALREHLAQVFSGGKLASEMVIEDRGPY